MAGEEEQQSSEAVEGAESWPPGEADHDDASTWAGQVDCDCGE